MEKCIFCKIARGEVQTFKVFEDEISLGFLDINPRSKGMVILIPKEHLTSFLEKPEISSRLFKNAMIICEKIRKALKPKDVWMSTISSVTNHLNIRIYPVYEDQIPLIENKPLQISKEELEEIARRIISEKVEIKVEEKPKVEEKKIEESKDKEVKKRSKEEVEWMKIREEIT